ELICAHLRRRWETGAPVRIEAYLTHYPELANDQAAVVELIAAEHAARQRGEELPAPEEYQQRFPHLSQELTQRLREGSASAGPVPGDPLAARELSPTLGPPEHGSLVPRARGGDSTAARHPGPEGTGRTGSSDTPGPESPGPDVRSEGVRISPCPMLPPEAG